MMNVKKGVIAIVFSRKTVESFFLLVHRSFVWDGWEFPKSILKLNETDEQAMVRMVSESTGLKRYKVIKKLPHLRQFVHRNTHYKYSLYLVEADMDDPVLIGDVTEHDGYCWASSEDALGKLYFDNEQREVKNFEKNF